MILIVAFFVLSLYLKHLKSSQVTQVVKRNALPKSHKSQQITIF